MQVSVYGLVEQKSSWAEMLMFQFLPYTIWHEGPKCMHPTTTSLPSSPSLQGFCLYWSYPSIIQAYVPSYKARYQLSTNWYQLGTHGDATHVLMACHVQKQRFSHGLKLKLQCNTCISKTLVLNTQWLSCQPTTISIFQYFDATYKYLLCRISFSYAWWRKHVPENSH